MSDILERLREADKTSPTETWAVWDLYREAADEIERLRAALSKVIDVACKAALPSPPTQEGDK